MSQKIDDFTGSIVGILDSKDIAFEKLTRRVEQLESALYPFQNPEFTKIERKDDFPMWGFGNAVLDYGDFRRARSLFGSSVSFDAPQPVPATPETPALTLYGKSMVLAAEHGKADKRQGGGE